MTNEDDRAIESVREGLSGRLRIELDPTSSKVRCGRSFPI